MLANLYNGTLMIWNYNDGSVVKTFEVTDFPIRTAKFVARKQWIVCGADDMRIRVYNYDTMEKVNTLQYRSVFAASLSFVLDFPIQSFP